MRFSKRRKTNNKSKRKNKYLRSRKKNKGNSNNRGCCKHLKKNNSNNLINKCSDRNQERKVHFKIKNLMEMSLD